MMRNLILMLALPGLIACTGEQSVHESITASDAESTDTELSEMTAGNKGISWFDGTIEAAFAEAATADKPVFLYWGAVWCPPCQEIKHTVFKSADFAALSRLFVPVYLDGDTDRAQIWGDKFGVKGYPTMIVFDPRGEELTRIPGGIDIERYNAVLSLALNEMQPTSTLVKIALEDPARLNAKDFQQLAYYSWWQDDSALPELVAPANLFLSLSEAAIEDEHRARFFMHYLSLLAQEGEQSLDAAAIARLETILSDQALVLACWDTLAYAAADILELTGIQDRGRLQDIWVDAVLQARHDTTLSKTERLAAWFPRLETSNFENTPLSASELTAMEAELDEAQRVTRDNYERQSVVYQISSVYRAAGMNDVAKQLLLDELPRSASPYYFMSSLAGLAEERGDHDAALDWRQQAYETSVGEATRFQWGVSYVQALIRLSPQSLTEIPAAAALVLKEIESAEALLAQRNYRRLVSLHTVMRDWEREYGAQAPSFAQSIMALCAEVPDSSPVAGNCARLAETLELGAVSKQHRKSPAQLVTSTAFVGTAGR